MNSLSYLQTYKLTYKLVEVYRALDLCELSLDLGELML